MKKNIILLVVLALMYLGTGFTLNSIYGESYPFISGDNYWMPDGSGGWEKHGEPKDLMPTSPSVTVPLILNYVPILLPGFVLMLFLFTPLGRVLETKREEEPEEPEEKPEADL